jgi:hypothetical protein
MSDGRRTKPVEYLEFFFEGGTNVLLICDSQGGDTMSLTHDGRLLRKANGDETFVPPGWKWMTRHTVQVPIKDA